MPWGIFACACHPHQVLLPVDRGSPLQNILPLPLPLLLPLLLAACPGHPHQVVVPGDRWFPLHPNNTSHQEESQQGLAAHKYKALEQV